MSKLKKSEQDCSKHEKIFKHVGFGKPEGNKFYSHIFYLPEKDFVGDVPESSLFNLDTLKMTYAMFESFPDIFSDQTQCLEDSELSKEGLEKLADLTKRLKLDSNEQTYLLGIYLKHLYEDTGMRVSDGGDKQKTFFTQVGIESLQGTIEWMSTEFPAILYGGMMASKNQRTCEENVKVYFKDTDEKLYDVFCDDPQMNLVSAESYTFFISYYFNRDPESEAKILKSGIPSIPIEKKFEEDMFKVMKKVKSNYADNICSQSYGEYCSNRELALAQWFNSHVSQNPPKPYKQSNNLADMAGIPHYKPELSYFYERKGYEMPEESQFNLTYVWQMMDEGYFANDRIIGDMFLGTYKKDETSLKEGEWKDPLRTDAF